MTRSYRGVTRFVLCGILAAGPAFGGVCPSYCTVPCAIVLAGHNFGATAADPYGNFTVVIRDCLNNPVMGATITINLGNCCPDIRLSNTQLGSGVSHVPGSAIITGITDPTGTAVLVIEGAATGSPVTPGSAGCATISATPLGGLPILITDGISHPLALVSAPDLSGVAGTPGVDVADLAFWITDKNAYAASTANYRQRSDYDYHLPSFNCIPLATGGNGVGVADLAQWLTIKIAGNSFANGLFPVNCP